MDVMAFISNGFLPMILYLPLDFWFLKMDCALKIIALQYHEVKVRVEMLEH